MAEGLLLPSEPMHQERSSNDLGAFVFRDLRDDDQKKARSDYRTSSSDTLDRFLFYGFEEIKSRYFYSPDI